MTLVRNDIIVDTTKKLALYALPLATMSAFVIFAIAQPAFLSPSNLLGIVRQMALVGIMASSTTFVIMTGGVDLSVGPVLALAGLASFFCLDAGYALPLVVAAGLATGMLVGLFNGLIISFFGLPPIIVTLSTLSITRGSALLVGGPSEHQIRGQPAYSFIGSGMLLGIPFPIIIFLAVACVMIFLQRRTALGLRVAAVGESERAAYLSGHNTHLTKVVVYVLSGLGAGISGIILSSQVHTALATSGPFGTELDVIAAVILGGASIMGGTGSVAHTLLGVLFLGVLNSGMNILNVPIDAQLMMKGAIIVLALSFAQRR